MLEVVERKPPFLRILPPYLQGLFATMASPNPTAVNNVETLSHVTSIFAFREAGVVYGQHRDIVQVAHVLARFLAVESCGQCLTCKLGTTEICERLDRLVRGEAPRPTSPRSASAARPSRTATAATCRLARP